MDDGNEEPLLGFLFGNVDQHNRVDADYLDDDARDQLAGLARIQGDLGLKESLQETGATGTSAPQGAEDGVTGPRADAEDYGNEVELIADEGAGTQASLVSTPGPALVAQPPAGGAAEQEEDDYDMESEPEALCQLVVPPVELAVAGAGSEAAPGPSSSAQAPEQGAPRPAPPATAPGAQPSSVGLLARLPALAPGPDGRPMLRFSELFGPALESAGTSIFPSDRVTPRVAPLAAAPAPGTTGPPSEAEDESEALRGSAAASLPEGPDVWEVPEGTEEAEAAQPAPEPGPAPNAPGVASQPASPTAPAPGGAPPPAWREQALPGLPDEVFSSLCQADWEAQVRWGGDSSSDDDEEEAGPGEPRPAPATQSATPPDGWRVEALPTWRLAAEEHSEESDVEEVRILRPAPVLRLEEGWRPTPGAGARSAPPLLAWEHRVRWDGAGSRPPAPAALWLDLNDPGLTFAMTAAAGKKLAGLGLHAAAARILPYKPAGRPSPSAASADPGDGAAADLARLNVSLDSLYSQHTKKRAGGTVGRPGAHARPAADLLTIPVKLSVHDKDAYHRPRATWWPVVAKKARLQLKPPQGPTSVASVNLTALPGFAKSYLNVDVSATSLSQLWEDLLSNGFEEAREKGLTPFMLLPGKPPQALRTDVPLQEAGIRAGDTKVNLMVAFQELILQPNVLANAHPDETNPALLRPPMAFSKRKSLAAEDGHLILLEYLEQTPLLLNRPGMGARLQLYYRRKNVNDTEYMQLTDGDEARWKVGSVLPLGDDDESPFLGDLKPGARQLAVETGLFRAPAQPYDVPPTDFLLVRSPTGIMRLRAMTGTIALGQQLPHHRIPAPNSRDVKDLEERRLYVYVFKRLRRLQAVQDRKAPGTKATISLKQLHEMFPNRPESMIRIYLKESCDLQISRSSHKRDDEVYELKDGARLPSEPELRRRLSPEEAVTLEAASVAEHRLKAAGILLNERFGSVTVEKLRMAAAMLPPDPPTQRAARYVEAAMQAAPWLLTDAAVAGLREGRGNLQLAGPADPTGRGVGYSFIRDVRHKAVGDDLAKSLARKQAGKVQGTDADLRRMTTDAAKKRLMDYGLTLAEIEPLGRWVRIDLVRQFANAAAADGVGGNMKFVRHQKTTLLEQQKKQREKAQEIFEKQMAVLHDTAEEDLGNQEELEAELERELLGEAEKKKPSQELSAEEELRELERMRTEGLLGEGSSAPGAAPAPAAGAANEAGLVPGKTRRIRRVVMVRGEDGQWAPAHEVVYSGRDAPYALASLYQKEGAGHSGPWGFGQRTISGRPRGLPKLSYTAARGRGMGRGRGRGRGGAGAGGAAGGAGRGGRRGARRDDDASEDEALSGLSADEAPAPKTAKKKARPALSGAGGEGAGDVQAPSADGQGAAPGDGTPPATGPRPAASAPVYLEDDDLELISSEDEAGAAAEAEPSSDYVPDEEELVERASPGPDEAATPPPGPRPLQATAWADAEDPDFSPTAGGGGGVAHARPATSRRSTGRAASCEARPADSGATVDARAAPGAARGGAGDGDGGALPAPRFKLKIKLGPAAPQSPGGAAPAPAPSLTSSLAPRSAKRQRSSLLEMYADDLALSDGADGAEDADFEPEAAEDHASDGEWRAGRRGGGGGAAARRSRDFGDESSDPEAPSASRRSRASKPRAAPGPAKRARRAAAVQSVAAVAALTGPDDKPRGKHPVNKFITTIITRLKRKKLWKMYFGGPVTSAAAPDYHNWVRPQDEMYLDKIQKKAGNGKYTSVDGFRQDLNAILTNAIKYNSIGHGRHGGPDVISYAEGLVSDAEVEIEALYPEISAAQAAWDAPPEPYPEYAPVAAEPHAALAPQMAVQQDQWVQCNACQKWRVISPAVYQDTVSPSSNDPWYCSMNYDRPGAGCQDPEDTWVEPAAV